MSASELLRILRTALSPGDPSKSILPFVPRPLKWLFLLVLLINVRGLPLTWHFRVFRPAIYARILNRLRSLTESPAKRTARLTSLCPVGVNPFESETVFRTRATPDVCDFNWHLSNSSYAMSYDMVRFKYVVEHYPLFYKDGGWIALGATHYSFSREIPMNATYEIRISMASWDRKWMYMIAQYVTYPKSKSSKTKLKSQSPQPPASKGSALAMPSIVTPAGSTAPSPSRSPAPTPAPLGVPLPPGAIVHCTAVSRLCCKIGRITIPPAVVIAASGFAMPQERFAEIQKWRLEDDGKRIRDFYAGGWKDVPEGERWWEEALGGEVERRRREGLAGIAGSVGVPVVGRDV